MLNDGEKAVNKSASTNIVDKKDDCNKPGGCGNCMKGGMPMKKEVLSFVTLLLIGVSTVLGVLLVNEKRANMDAPSAEVAETAKVVYELPKEKVAEKVIELPEPVLKGKVSVEESIQNRRSERVYTQDPVTLKELGQILWSAQGITDKEKGYRSAPSAHNAYPYNLYVVVRNVEDLENGLYLYDSKTHSLGSLGMVDVGEKLIATGLQDNSQKAPVVIAMAAVYAKMQAVFPDFDPKPNTHLEAGHIGQNMYLQAEALNKFGLVVTGGFNPVKVAEAMGLDPKTENIVYLVPMGHVK